MQSAVFFILSYKVFVFQSFAQILFITDLLKIRFIDVYKRNFSKLFFTAVICIELYIVKMTFTYG